MVKPRRIIINFGTNNAGSTSTEDFISMYRNALAKIKDSYSYADIIVASIYPIGQQRNYPNITMQDIDSYNIALAQMCRELGYKFLNTAELFKNPETGFIKEEYISSDGIHLSSEGYKAFIDYVNKHQHIVEDNRPARGSIPTRRNAPVATPTPSPTPKPSPSPSPSPSISPSPSPSPSISPSPSPSLSPSPSPTVIPTRTPTVAPTATPTVAPTETPVPTPAPEVTQAPTAEPTQVPTPDPTPEPVATCPDCGSKDHTSHPTCPDCGSKDHTSHPTCPDCGSKDHTSHPTCPDCGSKDHTSHPTCPDCGSKDHTKHPEEEKTDEGEQAE